MQKSVHYEKPHQIEERTAESIIFGKPPKFQLPPSTLEYAISITASLAHYFLGQRRTVGYVSAGQTFIVHSAERGERQEAKILETLAFVEGNGKLSIAALVTAQASQLPQGSSVVLVTSTVRPDLLQAVDDLQMRYLRPLVVLLDEETFGGLRGADVLVRSLRERRVPVCWLGQAPRIMRHDRCPPLPGAFRLARRNRSLGTEQAPRIPHPARRPLARKRAREGS